MLRGMNSGHGELADWCFTHLPTIHPVRIVDLGCGAGRNAAELLRKYPDAHVTAIDYSSLLKKRRLTTRRASTPDAARCCREMYPI